LRGRGLAFFCRGKFSRQARILGEGGTSGS
jgi:hypothetical protein